MRHGKSLRNGEAQAIRVGERNVKAMIMFTGHRAPVSLGNRESFKFRETLSKRSKGKHKSQGHPTRLWTTGS